MLLQEGPELLQSQRLDQHREDEAPKLVMVGVTKVARLRPCAGRRERGAREHRNKDHAVTQNDLVLVAWGLLIGAEGLGARVDACLDERLCQRLGECVVGGRMAYEQGYRHALASAFSFSRSWLVTGYLCGKSGHDTSGRSNRQAEPAARDNRAVCYLAFACGGGVLPVRRSAHCRRGQNQVFLRRARLA